MKNDIKTELTPLLCRLGRTAAELTQDQLAAEIRVSTKTIAQFEAGNTNPQRRTREDIAAALARRVDFIPEGPDGGAGVRLRIEGCQMPAPAARRSLPDIIASLPEPTPEELSDGTDQSARGYATDLLGDLLPKARELVDILRDEHPTQAADIAGMFGISIDPVPGLTWDAVFAAVEKAGATKAEVKGLLGSSGSRWLEHHRSYNSPLTVEDAYTARPLLERFGLWRG
ncbi:hypothetical protein [Azospirillum argentinense]|uniref:helix-turn-helix transcriptional regulator n=1 Tax=Azospirillum argentinense TaxID=2970906 RepID=UPI0032DE7637